MTNEDIKQRNKKIQREHYGRGDFSSWYDHVYLNAEGNEDQVPWAKKQPNSHLMAMLNRINLQGKGKRAIVVACGLGDDAEELSRRGFDVTAFDISATAIEWCKKRFPESKVVYQQADLLNLPAEWQSAFDFAHEAHTLQSLPSQIRQDAIGSIAKLLKDNGEFFIISFGREEDQEAGEGPPWKLAKSELLKIMDYDFTLEYEETVMENNGHRPGLRFRLHFRKIS